MMNHYFPYIYKIRTWSELQNGKLETECGLVYANDYAEAMKQISQFYGEDMIEDVQYLTVLEDGPIVISEKVMNAIINDEY